MNTLERWQSEKRVELVGAYRLLIEAKRHPLQPAANHKVAAMPNISEPCIWGIGAWGLSKWGAEGDFPAFSDLATLLFPSRSWETLTQNQINDVMHLMAHCARGAYAFLTDNSKDFIQDGRREALLERYGIKVMTAIEAVNFLRRDHGWN